MDGLQGKSRLSFWVLILLIAGLPCCGGYINYPVPKLVSLAPPNILAGSPQFFLLANGKDFSPGSIVEWNGTALITIFLSQTQLQATVPAALVQNPGTSTVLVFTTQPGGGTSGPVTFTITPNATPVPHIDSLKPPTVLAGAPTPVITVRGENFVTTSEAIVNGITCISTAGCTTAVASSTSLFISLGSALVANGGTLDISILNPPAPPPAPPNGGNSNTLQLQVLNPIPAITTLSPVAAVAGGTLPVLFTVTGTSLVSSSVIEINGAPRPTTLASATTLTTQLTQGDLAAGGVDQVQVFNPAPAGGTSNILTFAVNPTNALGLPILVDYAADGSSANLGVCGTTCSTGSLTPANAGPSSSTTGQFVAFAALSTNLLAGGTNGVSNIFVRNTCLGQGASCSPITSLITTDPNGNGASGSSFEPALDNSGTHVAFTSLATNLVTTVPLPAGTRQVFWRPTCTTVASCTGTANATQLVSISADGLSAGNGDSFNAAISPEGRYVAFVSLATNLVSNVAFDGVTPQVFIRDTCNGAAASTTCAPTTFLVSTSDGTTPANGASANPSVGNAATNISFTSSATNLTANQNLSGAPEIFLRTCSFNASQCVGVTNLISTPDGVAPANGASSNSSIAADGRFVAFASAATNLGVNSAGVQQIYVRDTCTDTTPCTPSLALISSSDGVTPGNATSERPSMSQTGQMIAFASVATNLGFHTANGVENVFVRNTCATITTACSPATSLASQPAAAAPPANGASLAPSVSLNGHTVSFFSFANNLVARDTNGFSDIFLASTTF
ncbi:MAG TPA: hypothetical protein VEU52_10520 [Candidatus Limnocylindrales bacterium]|nr:hypothetical protein [Candidatus Limnocylindrales bacterium]